MQSLTDNEYFESFIKSLDRNYLSSIIFNAFNYKLQAITNKKEINVISSNLSELSQKVTNIIESRQNAESGNKTEHNVYKLDKIDKLPLNMISNISSFLPYSDLTSFELCNRTIFVGSRTPLSLHSLPTKRFADILRYCTTNKYKYHWKLYRFRFCKSINLWLEPFFNYQHEGLYFWGLSSMYVALSDLFNWKNVESLALTDKFQYEYNYKYDIYGYDDQFNYDDYEVDEDEDEHEEHHWYKFTENLKLCDMSNIETISIYFSRYSSSYVPPLELFPSVKYVDINGCLSGITTETTIKLPASTEGVIMGNDFVHQQCQIRHNLDTFHGPQGIPGHLVSQLKNIKELCVSAIEVRFGISPRDELSTLIENGLPYLERIRYHDGAKDSYKAKDLMLEKLWKMESVNSIHIQCEYTKIKHYIIQLMKIFKEQTVKKCRMKVQIDSCSNDRRNRNNAINEDVSNDLKQLIKIMAGRFNDFMFIGRWKLVKDPKMNIALENIFDESMYTVAYWKKDDEALDKEQNRRLTEYELALKSIMKECRAKFEKNKRGYVWYKFAISNKKCRINGYSERWLMKCDKCESTPLFTE